MAQNPSRPGSRISLRAIATDIHFWIPFAVLVGGLLLLNNLR
jgi:hypothetical protein